MLLSLEKKSGTNIQKNSLFPTSIPQQGSSQQNNQPSSETAIKNTGGNQGLIDLTDLTDSTDLTGLTNFDISTITPVETEDFKLQYSPKLNKIVVERKTPQADEKFKEWAYQYNLPQLVENNNLVATVEYGKGPDDFDPLLEFLNIFMNFGRGSQQQSTINNQQLSSSILNTPSSGFTYFAQCNGYGNLPLPNGCTLCKAGCGPTTVAMIAASYLGSNYTPKTIVDIYKSKGYLLGCYGSGYSEAKQVLQDLGLKTTDYLIFNTEKADTVVPELRPYLNAGWTFFILANFLVDGGGHFFWITDIDDQNNIWAYDPYYGRSEIPYNENSRYPYPLYRVAFGVKK